MDDTIRLLTKKRLCKDGIRRAPRKHEREAAVRIKALEAENARLRAALENIGRYPVTFDHNPVHVYAYMQTVARAALKGDD